MTPTPPEVPDQGPEHNPDGLTPEQYGAPVYRLLGPDEVIQEGDEYYSRVLESWEVTSNEGGNWTPSKTAENLVYRRRVAPEQALPATGDAARIAELKRQLAEAREENERFIESLRTAKRLNDSLRAQLAASEKDRQWKPISEDAEDATEILGYNPEWVHAEFSPDGVRSCIYDGETWHSSTWRDDDFNILRHNAGDAPTHWMPLPKAPDAAMKEVK